MGKTAGIQYPYAYDEEGDLVHIDSVNKECRHSHAYTCPCCGNTMTPRLGEINAHCFAHSPNHICSEESYIHAVGKKILKETFDRSETYFIRFHRQCICQNSGSCTLFDIADCSYYKIESIDLKDFYDLPAEIEYHINGASEYRADVALLSSKPNTRPILLEVWHKHKSSEDKRKNNAIIEFRIRTFEDLKSLETDFVEENQNIQFYGFKKNVTSEDIERYIRSQYKTSWRIPDRYLPGCKRRLKEPTGPQLSRISLMKDMSLNESTISSSDVDTHDKNAIADITSDPTKHFWGIRAHYLLREHFPSLRSCYDCDHCIATESVTWCSIIKNGSTRHGNFNESKGASCPFFVWNDFITFESSQLKEGVDYRIWIKPAELELPLG